jgi:hypothetical protein
MIVPKTETNAGRVVPHSVGRKMGNEERGTAEPWRFEGHMCDGKKAKTDRDFLICDRKRQMRLKLPHWFNTSSSVCLTAISK